MLLLETNLLLLVWKVTFSLYLKHYMAHIQVANGSTKFSQTFFTLKDSHDARPTLMYGCNVTVTLMNVAVYVDDVLCTMKDPRSFLDCLIQVHKYKLKGDEHLSFHFVCDFGCDPDGTCYYQPKKYISKMLSTYKHMFPGESLKKQARPILKGDQTELDDLEFISEEDKAKYMSMISTAQWLVTLGRLISLSPCLHYRCIG